MRDEYTKEAQLKGCDAAGSGASVGRDNRKTAGMPPPPWAIVGAVLCDIALDFALFYSLPPRRRP